MTSQHPSVRALNAEWSALAASSGDHLRSWAESHPVLAPCAGLDDVLAAIRARPDEVLAALLTLGASGDGVAHRVVLQTMLGKVVRLAGQDSQHDVDDYLSELWLRIVTYPLARRPGSIAANLALDTRKKLRSRDPAVPVDPASLTGVLDDGGPAEPSVQGVLVEAERLGLIDARTRHTLRVVYGDGLRSSEAARLLSSSPEAVRWRCSRALRRLARHAEALLPAG